MSDFSRATCSTLHVCLFVAVVMGFMTGLLRSLATIFGYVRHGRGRCCRAEADVLFRELSEIRTATDVDRGDRDLRRGRSRDWRTSSTGCR